jgi:tRNA(fMet)-specific endonuclease VapC
VDVAVLTGNPARPLLRGILERARLEQVVKAPSFADGQIAAIAAVHGLTLVARNVSDFTNFKRLRVEKWFK